jgi:hypothetical protein
MTKSTGTLARMCYTLRYSRLARGAFALLILAAIGTTVFARPKQLESQTVRDLDIKSVNSSMEGQYIRVQGMYDPDLSFQRYLRLQSGYERSFSGNFIVMADPSSRAVIWVDRRTAPSLPPNEPLSLIGRVQFGVGDLQPPFFLYVEEPPNVRLANILARIGLLTLLLGAAAVAVVALVQRSFFALPALFQRAPAVGSSNGLFWFGGLGRQYEDFVVHNEPGRFIAGIHEGRIESTRAAGLWSISIRRLRYVDLFDVATPHGALPAARIRFEDERGMQRGGVLAAGSAAERDAVLDLLHLIRS